MRNHLQHLVMVRPETTRECTGGIRGFRGASGGRPRGTAWAPRLLLVLGLLLSSAAFASLEWPKEVTAQEGSIIVYQPQPESLDGNTLTGRAAMSLELKGRPDAIFGAFWFEAKIDTDRAAGTAQIRDLKVTQVRWPDSKDAGEQRFTAVVEAAIPENGFTISLERLSASLKVAEIEQDSLRELKHEPPQILFREEPAVLLLYDGEPRYAELDNSPYERVLNTPLAVVAGKKRREYWLSSGKFWYRADNAMGPWKVTDNPPADLEKMLQQAATDAEQPDSPPAIVAVDEPTELIVTQGKPDWKSLQGGAILYVNNTESPWLRYLSNGNMYLLLSGRWYRAKSDKGPWTFVPADELPAEFRDIPPDSDIGGLRTAVAGTPEAEDALLDAQIPQTAAIKRDAATLEVEYDGKPKFEKVTGTSVSYAVNTATQVLLIDKRYYAVDNGVWFTAGSATGPWQVADSIPEEEIGKIPPSSPVYNTTYVHVYESTPDIVYVGYLPGYMWSFPYYGVPVYGTGWYYPPYYGRYYYPRPPTWGFNVGYNPWTGWSFGLSYSTGFFTFGVSWGGGYHYGGCCGGWYGGGYRGPVVINTGDINIGNNVNVGNRTNIGNRIDRGDRVRLDNSRQNIYHNSDNRARLADATSARKSLKQARPATGRANNVFADANGNIAQRGKDGWKTRSGGDWQVPGNAAARDRSADTLGRTATGQWQGGGSQVHDRAGQGHFDRAAMDRANLARQRGMARERARPQMSRTRLRR